jgi:uncharacterized phosphatase
VGDMIRIETPKIGLFYFIRHGETDWNRKGIYQGPHDIPLNETGIAQAKEAAVKLASLDIDAIVTSPLSRALSTAKIISEVKGDWPLTVMSEFVECRSETSARFVLRAKGVDKYPSFEKVAGFEESVEEFLERMKVGLTKLLVEAEFNIPLVVAHGGTCTGICEILGVKPPRTPNCQLIKFECAANGEWRCESVL